MSAAISKRWPHRQGALVGADASHALVLGVVSGHGWSMLIHE